MTIKEELLQEIETTPPSMLGEILNFIQFIKTKSSQEEIKDSNSQDLVSQADTLRQRLQDTYGIFPDSVELSREDRDR